LVSDKVISKKKLADLEKDIIKELDKAVEYAKESPFPSIEEMYEDVYV
jgi:pyruvate dehydrogenase E1 component alpha subunit